MWCLFHGHSEEKAPFPCDDKLPPAKMSAYRCHFYGYIVGNGPKYELTRTSLGGSTTAFSETAGLFMRFHQMHDYSGEKGNT